MKPISMASPHTLLSTTSFHHHHHRLRHSTAPSRRKPPPQITCCSSGGGGDKIPETKVDRRNLLVGLSGLCSASNLTIFSEQQVAHADPIQPPDFSKCGAARDLGTGDLLNVNCCPPLSNNIIDYKLPDPPASLRMRPPAHMVTKDYLEKFEHAIKCMKELDKDPTDPRGFMQQANIHCAYCNGAHDQVGFPNLDIQVHNSWLFFPFHRWYIYFYERIMGKLIGDSNFVLPFWNWDNDPHGMQMPPMFDNVSSPLYDPNRNQTHRPPALIDLGYTGATDDAQLVANNLAAMYSEMIRSVNSVYDFMGQPYRAGGSPSPGVGTSERGSHSAAHVWVGDPRNKYLEDMGNFYSSGRDVLFYCHHANVDRMWAIWKTLNTPVAKDIKDHDYLNAAFLFYDEEKRLVRVTVADCLDHKKMGYDWEPADTPWMNYKPQKKAAKAKIKDLKATAQRAEGLFPLTLKKTTRVLVPKSAKGKADEVLLVENIVTDSAKFIKFDVFVNDEDDKSKELNKAEYAGTFAQVPHKTKGKKGKSNISLRLTELYEDIDVGDDDAVVVTLVPRSNGGDVTIGGIKIIPSPPRSG